MARLSSSLTSSRAPTSSQVTSGTVAKPSLFSDGCTTLRASWRLFGVERGKKREIQKRRDEEHE